LTHTVGLFYLSQTLVSGSARTYTYILYNQQSTISYKDRPDENLYNMRAIKRFQWINAPTYPPTDSSGPRMFHFTARSSGSDRYQIWRNNWT